MDIKQIGLTIKNLRTGQGLTQSALAMILNVSDKTVSKWESGNGLPELETLLRIADYFKISLDDLVRGKTKTSSHTEFLYIMDASGSMYHITDDVIGGFNSFLDEQKRLKDEAFITSVLFNHDVNELYRSINIHEADKINRLIYKAQGSTALFDAIGLSVLGLEQRVHTDKVLVTIMTDGYENASKMFTRSKIKRLIESKSKQGWEFIFAGANIDVDKVSDDLGIKKDRRVKFTSDSVGTRKLYDRVSKMTSSYRQTGTVDVEDKD